METWIILGIIVFVLWYFSYRDKNKITYTDTTTSRKQKVTKKIRNSQDKLVIEKPENFEITDEIRTVLNELENSNNNIFLTGKAGSGKSTLLRHFRATTRKNPVVVAPTGIAAINVQGQTIHNFFGWGIDITPARIRRASYDRLKVFRALKMLIIDEVSMVRVDLFECIDKALRLNTGNMSSPFGGVQIVAIGDLYQLPPVVTNENKSIFTKLYSSPFFFSTDAYKKNTFKKYELHKIFRQTDSNFIKILNAIREGNATQNHLKLLNSRIVSGELEDMDEYVHLVPTNKMAKEINSSKMEELSGKSTTYRGVLTGNFSEKNIPTDIELNLKPGAKVMLLNNDREKRWVNGDIVKLLETRENSILVEFDDDTVAEIGYHTWETIKFVFDEDEKKIIPKKSGGFSQLPVKPAWAMTIHKAQGKTFDKLFIDIGRGAFAEGQTYVALSRCRSLDGLRLAAPITKDDIIVNQDVRDFMSFSKNTSKSNKNIKLINTKKKSMPKTKKTSGKISKKKFVLDAIHKLREGDYKGIHAVYSGFNQAFRDYYNEDPIKAVDKLVKDKVVITKPVKGGVMIYDYKEMNSDNETKSSKKTNDTLDKILG